MSMSSYRNRTHHEGLLGKDAELKSTPNGKVVNFSIAVKERWTDKNGKKQERTDWLDIEVWGPATLYAAKLTKGTLVFVEGKIRTREYSLGDVKVKAYSIVAESVRKMEKFEKAQDSRVTNPDAEDPQDAPY